MEIVDRVDFDDKIIGVTSKEEAHEKGYFHRVAAVFVFRSDGKLLVQLRTKAKNGLLDHTVGGHVRKGELYDDAVKREMKEEIGIEPDLRPVGTFYEGVYRQDPPVRHYFHLYETNVDRQQEKLIKADPREVERPIPMDVEEVISLAQGAPERFTVGFMTALNFYIKYKQLPFSDIMIR